MTRSDDDRARDAAARAEIAADIAGPGALPTVATQRVGLVDIPALRRRLGLTQAAFAELYGFPVATLRNWEQQRRLPDRSARVLLRLIEQDPEGLAKLAAEV